MHAAELSASLAALRDTVGAATARARASETRVKSLETQLVDKPLTYPKP